MDKDIHCTGFKVRFGKNINFPLIMNCAIFNTLGKCNCSGICKNKNSISGELQKLTDEDDKDSEKQIVISKRNDVLKLFDEVDVIDKEIQKTYNKHFLNISREEILKEETIANLNIKKEFLNKIKTQIENFKKKEKLKTFSQDTQICEKEDDFINKFNERKNILADRFNDELKNKLKSNNLIKTNIDDYFTMYQEMTKDVFTHGISLDLQIYRYILKLEGFVDALDEIIKKDKIRYDFFFNYEKSAYCYFTDILKKGENEYLLNYDYMNDDDLTKLGYKKYKEIYSGIFYIDNVPFKYLKCNKKCINGNYCISCKLRNLLENENIGDLYEKFYREYGNLVGSDAAEIVKNFVFSYIKPDYRKKIVLTKENW